MRPVERPFAPRFVQSRFADLPATFALAVLRCRRRGHEASAQGFGLQGFRKKVGSGGNANFIATKKSSLTKKVSCPTARDHLNNAIPARPAAVAPQQGSAQQGRRLRRRP